MNQEIESKLAPTEDKPYETKKAIKYSFIIAASIFFLSVIFAVFNAESFIEFLYIWGLSLFILFYIIWLPISALMYVGYLQKKKLVFLASLFFIFFLAIYGIIFFYSWVFLLSPRSDFPLLIQEALRLFPRMIFGLMPTILLFYFLAKGDEFIKKFGQRYWKLDLVGRRLWAMRLVTPAILLFLLIYPISILFKDVFIRDKDTSNGTMLEKHPFGDVVLAQHIFGRLAIVIPDQDYSKQEYEYKGQAIQKLIGHNEIITFTKAELKEEIEGVHEMAMAFFDEFTGVTLDQFSSAMSANESYSATPLLLIPNEIPGKMLEVSVINNDTHKGVSNLLMVMLIDDQNKHLYFITFMNLDPERIAGRKALYENSAYAAFFAD